MDTIKYLHQKVKVIVDRKIQSHHPQYSDLIYQLNYGYIPNTISGDGEELDAYILGIKEPLEEFTGEVIAIIHRTQYNDDKLIVVPQGMKITDEEIIKQTFFQEQYFKSIIIR